MKAFLTFTLFGLLLTPGLRAEDPPALPTPELVKSLITLEEEIKNTQINVAMILRGEICCEGNLGNFVSKDAVRVLMVMPIIEEGRRVRRVAEKIFLWNEDYGWFAYREERRRGGEEILIFSEKKGLVEIR